MTSISLIYLSSTAKVGDRIFIGVLADSGGVLIDGMDIMLTTTTKLKPVAYIRSQLMPVANYFQILPDGINFSQLCDGGTPLAVKGLIAVIECHAIATGYASMKFKFTLGSTINTNMAAGGKDILEKVVNKRIAIS
jgi:hypothetical protein